MTITERDALESRVALIEEKLRALEARLDASAEKTAPPAAEIAPEPAVEGVDFVLIAKSILIIGGAYLLRALTELGVLPQLAGMLLAFVYAITWMVVADMALRRGRRAAAAFDAATGALIAGGLIWEAASRFHVLPPPAAAALTAVVALGLLAVSVLRKSDTMARIAAVMTVLTLTGVSITSADVLGPMIAAAVVGVAAFRLKRDVYSTAILAVAGDFFAIVLIALAHGRTSAIIALIAFGAAWLMTNEVQAAVAILIGVGGASALALVAPGVMAVWSAAAAASAFFGRRMIVFAYFAPLWAIGAIVAALVSGQAWAFLAAGAIGAAALALMPADTVRLRAVMLAVVAFAALAAIQSAFELTATHRSLILAVAAAGLALAHRRESRIVAWLILIAGAVKMLTEDVRGSATGMVVALVAYGLAMLVVASRGRSTAVVPG